jgi:hypothetical protein
VVDYDYYKHYLGQSFSPWAEWGTILIILTNHMFVSLYIIVWNPVGTLDAPG